MRRVLHLRDLSRFRNSRLASATWPPAVRKAQPVLSLIDWQQSPSSPIFFDKTIIGDWDGHVFGSREWISLDIRIFPAALRGPHSGTRNLKVGIQLYDDASDSEFAFWSGSVPLSCELREVGWLEISERRAVDEVCAIRMAMSVAASAGGIESSERAVIKEWAREQLEFTPRARRAERKTELNGILAYALTDADEGIIDLGAEIRRLRDEGTEGGRLEAVELCVKVMGADGRADAEELEQVNKIARKLEIDESWFAQIRDKAVSAVAVSDGASADDLAAVLGIDLSGGNDSVRNQLNSAYDRWSSRATSIADPEKRAEAERMLDIVTEARSKLLA
jgi:uncharacterized tellurite resistance protein B-like protein